MGSGGVLIAQGHARKRDGRIRDVHGGPFAVAKHAVAVLSAGRDGGVFNGHRCAVGGQQGRVLAVEVAVLGVGGFAGALADRDAAQGDRRTVHPQGILVVAVGFIAFRVHSGVRVDSVGARALRHRAGTAKAASGSALTTGAAAFTVRFVRRYAFARGAHRSALCGALGRAGGGGRTCGQRDHQCCRAGQGSDAFRCESHKESPSDPEKIDLIPGSVPDHFHDLSLVSENGKNETKS